jgi:hypothetical protein
MAAIGNSPTQQAFTPAIDYFSGTGSATAFTLSRPVASVAQVQVTIDNVAQNPSSAFTVSGNTLTFTSAPLSGTNNIYVYYTSPITQVIAPGQGTVNATSLASSTGSGAVVLATSPTLVTPALGTPSALVLTNATGLPQAGLGTNVAGNGPTFSAYQSSATSLSNATQTKILYANESFDTNSNFASSRFTPTVAGYYQITASVAIQISGASYGIIKVNTTDVAWAYGNGIVGVLNSTPIMTKLVYLNGSTDYVEVYAEQRSGSTVNTDTNPTGTWFTGFLARSA